jgi:hypothetical protein
MSPRALLDRLSREGVSVRLDGSDVCLTAAPSSVIEAATISAVRAMKAELIAELQSASTEWTVDGCARFTALRDCDEAQAAARGCCIACGASIELHGRPALSEWRRVVHVDDVELVAARYILAKAMELVG